jgi:tetratricopeptide (TPR) repeat protein
MAAVMDPMAESLGPAGAGPPLAAPGSERWEQRRLAFLRVVLEMPVRPDFRSLPVLDVLTDHVRSFGGRLEEINPTGVVALFGLDPVEDAARRAVRAAMAIRKATQQAARSGALPVTLRVGIHVTPVWVDRSGAGAQIELEAKRAALATLDELIAMAQAGSISVSEAARPFLQRNFVLTVMKGAGASSSTTVYQVGAEEPRGLPRAPAATTFVGRRHELDILRRRLGSVMRGRGQVVGIVGEAGIGKSRLLYEFLRAVQDDVRLTWLEGHCLSHGSAVPYLPVLEIARRNFRVTDEDTPETISVKIRNGLREVGIDPAGSAPYLLQLFGVTQGTEALSTLTPGAIKAGTFTVLRQLTLLGSRRRPIVFVVEDLHWIDTISEECFAFLMDAAAAAPALLLATYRPGYRPPWLDKSYATQLALEPLSAEESLDVVRSVLRVDSIPERILRIVLEKTEGNPLFLEELARGVDETSELGQAVTVPDTIQALLLARVDRLPEEPKALLQAASVLGREFPLSLLQAVCDPSADVDGHLRLLIRLEFLGARGGGADPIYGFTHPLTQDIVYDSLPLPRRLALHAAAGGALEAAHADRLDEVCDRLAFHFARTEDVRRAVEYLTRAADKAGRGHAHVEEVQLLEEARRHAARLPGSQGEQVLLGLVVRQGSALLPLGRFEFLVDLLLAHQDALERLQDPRIAGTYHLLLARSYLLLGDERPARDHAARAIAEATGCGDQATLGRIHYVLAQGGAISGNPEDGLEHSRQALALLREAGDTWWLGATYWALALNHALLGEFEAGLAAATTAATMGEAVRDPQAQSSAAWATGFIRVAKREWDAAITACQRAVDLAPDPLTSALALGWLGYAWVDRGDAPRAIPLLEQSIGLLAQFRFPQARSLFTACLAEALRLSDRSAAAREAAREALGVARETGALFSTALALRELGRITLATSEADEAGSRLAEAVQVFSAMGARHEVARTRLDLARVAHAAGDSAAVTAHLRAARTTFEALAVPRYVELTDKLASELGVAP